VFRRFEASVAKAGWNIRVRLEAIEDLPEQYDVLVVSPALRERAEALEGDAILIVTTRPTAAAAVDQLLREIERGDPIAAERKDPNAPKIVTHRGMEIL
jgi:mannitol-specific phosphotransferase system IIBC component